MSAPQKAEGGLYKAVAGENSKGVKADLKWSLVPSADGKTLKIEYHVANEGDEAIYCLDRIDPFADADAAAEDRRIIALRDPDGPHLWLIRAFFQDPRVNSMNPWLPGVRQIPAGKSVTGHAEIGLPPQAWRPNGGGEKPLGGEVTDAVLQIGVAPLSLPMEDMDLSDGRTIHRPRLATGNSYQCLLLSDPLPLP
jgi:hypothetical protein